MSNQLNRRTFAIRAFAFPLSFALLFAASWLDLETANAAGAYRSGQIKMSQPQFQPHRLGSGMRPSTRARLGLDVADPNRTSGLYGQRKAGNKTTQDLITALNANKVGQTAISLKDFYGVDSKKMFENFDPDSVIFLPLIDKIPASTSAAPTSRRSETLNSYYAPAAELALSRSATAVKAAERTVNEYSEVADAPIPLDPAETAKHPSRARDDADQLAIRLVHALLEDMPPPSGQASAVSADVEARELVKRLDNSAALALRKPGRRVWGDVLLKEFPPDFYAWAGRAYVSRTPGIVFLRVDSQLLPSTVTAISVTAYVASRQGGSSSQLSLSLSSGQTAVESSVGGKAGASLPSMAAVDAQAWQAAQIGGTEQSYGQYLAEFPIGQFAQQAKAARDGIAEENQWNRAVSANREEEYARYLVKYPIGRYSAAASQRAGSWTRTDTGCLFRGELLRTDAPNIPSWSGACIGGLAEGKGVASGLRDGKPAWMECELRQGRCFGSLTQTTGDSTLYADSLVNGYPSGRVRVRTSRFDMTGNVSNGVMTVLDGHLNGVRLVSGSLRFDGIKMMGGTLLARAPDGITTKSQLDANGNCVGNLEIHHPVGAVMVGPCLKVFHGQYFVRWPSGQQEVITYFNGVQVAR